ncbi:MAG: CaiB/BaiF CoA transferase family protein [Bacilli bacterium]
MQPLTGVTVVDFTRVLAGPFCTMTLGDLGANVIKVESPAGGDDTRAWGPPFAGTESAYYLCANRNKRSIALDLTTPEGRTICGQLIRQADVVVHNFLPHSADKLGLSYGRARAVKPDVVHCSISGYGMASNQPGYDYILQAVGGLMSITGEADGSPVKVGVAITDLFTGLYAAIAIQAALAHRTKTGQGQQIDMALYDAQMAMLANVASNVLIGSADAERFGNEHPNIAPYQLFQTADSQVVVTVGNDRQFKDFCVELDLPPLWADPRYATNAHRVEHRDTLTPLLESRIAELTTAELTARMAAANVPCGPVRSVRSALQADETAARQMIWTADHSALGRVDLIGSPLKLLGTPPALRYPPPMLGEHTQEILLELAYTGAGIQTLQEKGVVRSCSISH